MSPSSSCICPVYEKSLWQNRHSHGTTNSSNLFPCHNRWPLLRQLPSRHPDSGRTASIKHSLSRKACHPVHKAPDRCSLTPVWNNPWDAFLREWEDSGRIPYRHLQPHSSAPFQSLYAHNCRNASLSSNPRWTLRCSAHTSNPCRIHLLTHDARLYWNA